MTPKDLEPQPYSQQREDMRKDTNMTPETNKGWELEFDQKCKESFALDGFLVKDLEQDWSYDVQSIKNFIHSELQKARDEGSKETIVCAAIVVDDGTVIRGHRHHDCIATALKIPDMTYDMRLPATQGFVTSRNRYVTRGEAYQIQKKAGIESVAEGGYRGEELYSEDLY